jgi:hypothetical protein
MLCQNKNKGYARIFFYALAPHDSDGRQTLKKKKLKETAIFGGSDHVSSSFIRDFKNNFSSATFEHFRHLPLRPLAATNFLRP